MASSATVGILRVLLSANTAEFDAAMKRASASADAWSKDLASIGKQASNVGATLTKALTLPLVAIGAGSLKAAIDFESSFAGIRKTVDGVVDSAGNLTQVGKDIQQSMRNLAKEIPVSVNELNKIGEAAGALGIKKEDIVEFTKTMAMLGVTTNLTSDQAATSIAQIQNIFNASGKDTSNFASALVALGNAGASTESQIVDFATRLAGAGKQIGLSQQAVLGFGSALANMGLNAELGGTALSSVMSKISVAVDTGGKKLEGFAKVAGMTGEAFKKLFKADSAEAIIRFTEGLGKAGVSGENLTIILKDLGLKGSNVQDVMKRLAGGADQMRTAVDLATVAWRENTALTKEAQQRFATTEAQLKLLWGRIQDVGITLGNALKPTLDAAITGLTNLLPVIDSLAKSFGAMPAGMQAAVIGLAGIVAAAGPVIYIFGQIAISASGLIGTFGKKGIAARLLATEMVGLGGAAAGTATSTGLLASAIGLLTNPITLAIVGTGLFALAIYKVVTAESDLEKSLRENSEAFRKNTETQSAALATYTELKGKLTLTTEETAKLDAVTRALAAASGLSKEAFEREAAASNGVVDALRTQLSARRELMAAAVEQSRQTRQAAEAALNAEKARLAEILSGKATKAETSGGTGGGGVIVRGLTAGERIAEIQRLNGVITGLTANVEKARTAYTALVGPLSKAQQALVDKTLARDTKTSWEGIAGLFTNVVTPAVRGAAGAIQSASESASTNAGQLAALRKEITDLSKANFTDLVTGIKAGIFSTKELATSAGISENAVDLLKKQLQEADKSAKAGATDAKQLAQALENIREAAIPLTDAQKEMALANEALTISHADTARVLGVNVNAIDVYIKSVKNAAEVEEEWVKTRADFAKKTKELQASFSDKFIADQRKEADASAAALAKLFTDREKYQERVTQLGLAGTALVLRQIEVQRVAELRALGERTEQNARYWDENAQLIEEFYAYERKLALGTADTIVERMRRQGIVTRADLQATAVAAKRDYEQMKASGLFTYEQLQAAAKRARDAQILAASDTGKAWRDAFQQIDETVSRLGQAFAQIAGSTSGDLSTVASTIAGIANAWNQAADAAEAYAKATTLAEKAAAIGQGIAAIASASDPRGKTDQQTILGSGAAGARLGAIAGPYGMAIGFVAGALIGWWRSAHAEWKKVAKQITKDLGSDIQGITQEVAQKIADLEKTLQGGTKDQRRTWAITLSLPDIIEAQGGLNAGNTAMFERQASGLFEIIRQGGDNAKKAIASLNTLIGQFAAQAEKTGGMWSPTFKQLIADSKALGVNIDAVNAAINTQISKLAGGLGKAITGAFSGTDAGLTALVTGLAADEGKALADGFKKAQESGFKGTINDYFIQQAKLYKAGNTDKRGTPFYTADQFFSADTLGKFETLTAEAQAAFDRLSRTALASFNAIVASGRSAFDAITEIGPAVDQLIAQHDKLGLQGGAAYDQLARFRGLVKDNEALVASVGGLNDVMTALANLGGLTTDTLADLEAQGLAAFAQLQAAGFTELESLKQMVPFLENVIKAHKDLGIPIDENTQKLIDLADANNLLSDETMSMNEILMQGFAALIEAIGGDLPEAWKRFGKAAQEEARKAKEALDKIPSTKTITIIYDEQGNPVPTPLPPNPTPPVKPEPTPLPAPPGGPTRLYARGGLVAPLYLASGGRPDWRQQAKNEAAGWNWNRHGTDTIPALLSPNEYVIDPQTTAREGVGAFQALQQGAATIVPNLPTMPAMPPLRVVQPSALEATQTGWSDARAWVPQNTAATPAKPAVTNFTLSLDGAQIVVKDEQDASTLGRVIGTAFMEEVRRGGEIRTLFSDEVHGVINRRTG